jgi:amino acid permease
MSEQQVEESRDVEEPLLSNHSDEEIECNNRDSDHSFLMGGRATVVESMSNLVLTSVGAGMLSLPRAYANVGLFMGFLISIFAGICTYTCCSEIVVACTRNRSQSYGACVKSMFGRFGYIALQSSIIMHVYGVMIVYIVIIGDVLVGDGSSGIVPYILGRPLESVLEKNLLVGVFFFCLVVPMLIPRTLDRVGKYSKLSVYLILFVAGTILGLCGLALSHNVAGGIDLLPPGGGFLETCQACFTSFSVTCLAFTCHFNLMAVQKSLLDPRVETMQQVMRMSTSFTTTLYTVVAASGYVLFGSQVDGDVLKNLTIEFTGTLLGKQLATAVIGLSMVAYCVSLCVNYVLKVWAVRNALVEVVLQKREDELSLSTYYILTFVLVVSSFAVSLGIPGVFFMSALIGSTACAAFSYFFPGLLMLRRGGQNIIGGFAIVFSITMAIVGTLQTLRNPEV